MKLVLDAGALLALERNDHAMWRRLTGAFRDGTSVVTHGGVLGQVWRGTGPRQARLWSALSGIIVRPLDATLGRAAGELLASCRSRDVIDAALVLLATNDDEIFTSDCDDIEALAQTAGLYVDLIPV